MKRVFCLAAPFLCFLTAACADMKIAKNAYQSGDYATAREHLAELSRRGFPEAQTKLGEMTIAGQGAPANPREGIRLLNKALEEKSPAAMLALGKAYNDGNGVAVNKVKARNLFERALALGDTRAYYQMGILEQEQNNLGAAEKHFVKALQSGDTRAWYQRGVVAERAGRLNLADQYFSNAVAAGDTQAYYRLGKLHMEQKQFARAELDFKKALSSGDAQAHFQLGVLHENARQTDAAIGDFKKAAAAGNNEAWRHLGDLYLAKNQPVLAEKAFSRGAALGDTTMHYRLGKLHQQTGKPELAEKDFARAVTAGEERAYYNLGNIHKKEGNHALAQSELGKAARSNPDAYLPLADAQRAMGNYSQAYENYEKALRHGNYKAFTRIAEMYRKGEGRPANPVQALSLLYKARKAGVGDLDTKIAHLEKKLQPEGLSKAYDLAKGDIK